MSLLTKASTVTTPTAYDGGVLNSVKPTNRENLLLQSNGFDTTWVNVRSADSSGYDGYDGTTNAWKFIDSIDSGTHRLDQVVTLGNSQIYSFSIYAKEAEHNTLAISIGNTSITNNYIEFNLNTGIVTEYGTIISSSMTSVGNGFYRCAFAAASGTADRLCMQVQTGTTGSYTGNGSDGIYIQDSQLQKGITATQYVETTTEALENADFSFARASSATRVNEQGYIEKERENLLLQSNQFDTTWTNFNSTETSGQSGYDGSSDAWLLTKTGANGNINQSISTINGVYTFSIYAKGGANNWVLVRVGGLAVHEVYFDLSSGSVGTETNVISSNITNVGNSYYRCSISVNVSSGNYVRLYVADSNGVTSGTSGNIYIQDAQVEYGLVATDYIETTTTSVAVGITNDIPRINYEGGNGNFLLEPQRTNLITSSEYFGAWSLSNATLTANNAESPEGVINGYKLNEDTANSTHRITQTSIVTAGQVYTQSVFAKGDGSGRYLRMFRGSGTYNFAVFDLDNGIVYAKGGSNVISAEIDNYGNGWYRCSLTFTTQFTNIPSYIGLQNGSLDSYQGDGTSGIYIYGTQLEAGYLTSYIPTYGSAVTRAAETCNNAGNSDLFNDSEGVLYAEAAALANDGTTKRLALSNSSVSSIIRLEYSATLNIIFGVCYTSGANQAAISYTLSDSTIFTKIAFKYKANDFALWVNGVEVGADSSGLAPSGLEKLNFDAGNGALDFYGKTKMVSTFTEALSDSELECLTSWSSFERMATAQNYTIE